MKKFKRFYCIQCLRKYRLRDIRADQLCLYCSVPLRGNTARIVAQVVTRLLRKRGLKPPKKDRSEYEAYLASQTWKTIRERILMRDNRMCQMCDKPAEVVHHKSYDRVVLDGERDTDLVSLCHDCHSSIEFDYVNGKRVKNCLKHANRKLKAAMRDHLSSIAREL